MGLKEKKYYVYFLFCLAILPILFLRDFTPSNELRYLSIADEALRNHTLFTFTNHDMPYADKPPLYLWLVMLLKSILGSHQMWALALLSLIPALVTVHTMDRWSNREIDSTNRLIAQRMLLTCGIFAGSILTIRMDMLMCMFIVLAMRSFWRLYTYEDGYRRERWFFPVFLFLALFTKGPLGILIPLFATLVFLIISRQYNRIFQIWGWRTWGLLLLCCGIWFGMVYAEGGHEYLDNLLFHQTIDRAVHAFHHNHPFYYYFICIWYCIAPWTIHITSAFAMSLRKSTVKSPLHVLYLTTALTTIALLSCLSGKLEIYLIPAFPFMIYATVMYFPKVSSKTWGRFCQDKFFSRCTLGIFVLLFVGGLCLPYYNKYIGYGELCKEVIKLSKNEHIGNIAAWNVSNAADMDVYLHQSVNVIDQIDSLETSIKCPSLLITKTKHQGYFSGCEIKNVGDYCIVKLTDATVCKKK